MLARASKRSIAGRSGWLLVPALRKMRERINRKHRTNAWRRREQSGMLAALSNLVRPRLMLPFGGLKQEN